jgi:hypothetical protein
MKKLIVSFASLILFSIPVFSQIGICAFDPVKRGDKGPYPTPVDPTNVTGQEYDEVVSNVEEICQLDISSWPTLNKRLDISDGTISIAASNTLPVTCAPNDLYGKLDEDNLYLCESTDTWVKYGGVAFFRLDEISDPTADTTLDGATNDATFTNFDAFSITANLANEIATTTNGEIRLVTKNVVDTAASVNECLVLQNATTGKVEYAPCATGSGTVISGAVAQYTPDGFPNVCHACEEFKSGEVLTWAWANQDSATLTLIRDSAVLRTEIGQSTNARVRWISGANIPSTGDFIFALKAQLSHFDRNNLDRCGISALTAGTEATPTELQMLYWKGNDASNDAIIELEEWTSYTGGITAIAQNSSPKLDLRDTITLYLAYKWDDTGNQVFAYYSENGFEWQDFNGNGIQSTTKPTSLGYFCSSNVGGANTGMTVEWFRVLNSTIQIADLQVGGPGAKGGGGSAVVLDIGDDAGDDSLDIQEIATVNDTNAILTEPADDKISIDFSKNWLDADALGDVDCTAQQLYRRNDANSAWACTQTTSNDSGDWSFLRNITAASATNPASFSFHSTISDAPTYIEVGTGGTGDRLSAIDFVGGSTYTDFGLRVQRSAGSNASSVLTHRGTGQLQFTAQEATSILFNTNNTTRTTIDSSGNITAVSSQNPASFTFRSSVTSAPTYIEVGTGGTGDRLSAIDFVGGPAWTDYGLRLQRSGGANGISTLKHRGTGAIQFEAEEVADTIFKSGGATRATIESDGDLLLTNRIGFNLTPDLAIIDYRNVPSNDSIGILASREVGVNDCEICLFADFAGAGSAGNWWRIGSTNVGWEPNAFIVRGDGRVGLGTTSPGYKLDINGGGQRIVQTGSTNALQLDNGGASGPILDIEFENQNTTNPSTWKLRAWPAGHFAIRDHDAGVDLLQFDEVGGAATARQRWSWLGAESPMSLLVGSTTAAATSRMELGFGSSGNRQAYIDYQTDDTYTDYGMRLIRGAGANSNTTLHHRGTGTLQLETQDAGNLTLRTSATDRIVINGSGAVTVSGQTTFNPQGTVTFGAEDTNQGRLLLHGSATGSPEGGEVTLKMSDDNDATHDSWNMDVSGTSLRFFVLPSAATPVKFNPTAPTNALVVDTNDVTVSTKYLQIPVQTGIPVAGDCDAAGEAGRVVFRVTGTTYELYLCTGVNGWKKTVPA